jgi:hypothetical protein
VEEIDMPCRQPRRHPETWTELVESGMDEYEIVVAMLNAANELIEDQEREIAELKAKLADAEAVIRHEYGD